MNTANQSSHQPYQPGSGATDTQTGSASSATTATTRSQAVASVLTSKLGQWWMDRARTEVLAVVPKAQEYGSGDLIAIGQQIARLAGRDQPSDAEAAELGVFFYQHGKMARWADALQHGRQVSDDTLHDIAVYAKMAQHIRRFDSWPLADLEGDAK